jgi:pimeloyl-ACP methyl ester carboxylesterase
LKSEVGRSTFVGGEAAADRPSAERSKIGPIGIAPTFAYRGCMGDGSSTLVLIHGAGSGPWVFDDWQDDFSGLSLQAIDLLEGLDVAQASMTDYRDRVLAAIRGIDGPITLCGWSMGGLVALMAAQETTISSLVLLEPSPPGEVQGFAADVELERGTFDPEATYGAFPVGVPSRSESSLARGERKRGISVPEVGCPLLVISGDEFVLERGEPVASFYGGKHLHCPGLDHWDLVQSSDVRAAIALFMSATA